MKYIEVNDLKDRVNDLYKKRTINNKVGVYESAEEYQSCNDTVTKSAIEKRITEKVNAYNNLPEGDEKQEITDNIEGMYVGMNSNPSLKTPERYYTDIAINELFEEERKKRTEILSEATPIDDNEYYVIFGHDFDRYEGGDFAVATFTSIEELEKAMPKIKDFYAGLGGSISSDFKVVDKDGLNIELDDGRER